MRVFIVVNQVDEIGFRQTTALIIAALVRQRCDVCLVDVDAFSVAALAGDAEIFARAIRVPSDAIESNLVESFAKSGIERTLEKIHQDDLVLIRTNPGRDNARTQIHESFLHLCGVAQTRGIRVFNAPDHLRYFASKSSLVSVDAQFRPAMVVTSESRQIIDFINNSPADCVAKPLFGSRGENVIRIGKSATDIAARLKTTFGNSTLVVQQFVEAEHPGDKRVVVLDGKILEIDGHIAGIERRPAVDDFRANLHAGGSAHELTLSTRARSAADYAARLLADHGIWLAGVDLIGDRIIEFNVFSTGGLFDSIQFSGVRFDDAIVEHLMK